MVSSSRQKCSVDGDGMVILGSALVTDFRKVNSSVEIGLVLRRWPVQVAAMNSCSSPSASWKVNSAGATSSPSMASTQWPQ